MLKFDEVVQGSRRVAVGASVLLSAFAGLVVGMAAMILASLLVLVLLVPMALSAVFAPNSGDSLASGAERPPAPAA